MIIYSVTVCIDKNVKEDWLNWMKEVHIQDVMKTGIFTDYLITKVLSAPEKDGGISYNIQYHCPALSDLEVYQNEYAPTLQKEHSERYKDKFVAFRTILEKV